MNWSDLKYRLGYLECMNDMFNSLSDLAKQSPSLDELRLIEELKRRIEENRTQKEKQS